MPASAQPMLWLHAIAAVLATAAALALVFVLLARPARLVVAAVVAATTALVAFATGFPLDQPYRGHVRQHLFVASPDLGWLFERKLHLAFIATALVIVAAAAALASARLPERAAADARRTARLSALAAAAFVLFATAASFVVAAHPLR